MPRLAAVLLEIAFVVTMTGAASADEDDDLDLIPKEILDEPKPEKTNSVPPMGSSWRPHFDAMFFFENAFTLQPAPRTTLVPYPATTFDWQNRTSFDAYIKWEARKDLAFTLSDRLDVLEQENVAFVSRPIVRNVFREGYVTWEAVRGMYFEAGRINVRNGVALGYNPTDFFKTRTFVGQPSLDPSAVRKRRLGTLMGRGQVIWNGGSASVAFAPKLYAPSSIAANDPLWNGPRFDVTNSANRLLCTLSFDFLNLNPQLLEYVEKHRSKIGLNLSRQIGDAVVAYAEWAGGPETNLITRSIAYGQQTGTLPSAIPTIPPTATTTAFRNDVAAGASWTVNSTVTLNLEYHLHEAGFTRQNWEDWFNIGSVPGSPNAGTLWYTRGYANDQQEPVTMHQMFMRVAWPHSFVKELELSGFAFISLLDASSLAQASATYDVSDVCTVAVYGAASIGGRRSERGSTPQLGSMVLQLVGYL